MSAVQEQGAGRYLRYWREVRGLSQMELALRAQVSARHVSFVETGRSHPSRELLLILAEALVMPLRDRNAMLLGAGYSSFYRETGFCAPEMEHVRWSLEYMLKHCEPYGALVTDRLGNVLMANRAMTRTLCWFLSLEQLPVDPPLNFITTMFEPEGMRRWLGNWPQVARALLARLHREAGAEADPRVRHLLESVRRLPGVAALPLSPEEGAGDGMVVPYELRGRGIRLNFMSTITTFGTPQDITLQELRIESFLPADPVTEEAIRGQHLSF